VMNPRLVLVAGALLMLPGLLRADKAVKCSIKTLDACHKIGCSKPGSPLAVTNSQKRTTAINGSPAKLTFEDLKALQADVDRTFANGPVVIKGQKISSAHNIKAAPRKIILSGLTAATGTFSEGDFVELEGFIAATKQPPHPNTGESVNCDLTDRVSNDYHINITPAKNEDEAQGVVVEMIPQNPHRKNDDWDLDKLKKIQKQQMPVKLEGHLFFDSEHAPNTQKNGKSKNPKRFSVWEIHPLTSFQVCVANSCTESSGWKALEDWTPSN
jgi:hypothetical protein